MSMTLPERFDTRRDHGRVAVLATRSGLRRSGGPVPHPVSRPVPWPNALYTPATVPIERLVRCGFEVVYTTDAIHRVRVYAAPDRFAVRVCDAEGTYPQAHLCPSVSVGTSLFCRADGRVTVQSAFARPAFYAGAWTRPFPPITDSWGADVLRPGHRLFAFSPKTFDALAPRIMNLIDGPVPHLMREAPHELLEFLAAGIDDAAGVVITRLR